MTTDHPLAAPLAWVRDPTNLARFKEELAAFLRIRSVSQEPEHRKEMARAAGLIKRKLKQIGMRRVRVISLPGGKQPLVYAVSDGAPGKPWIILGGHYDVVPGTDEQFEPSFEGEIWEGRGTGDNKVHLWMQLYVLEGFFKTLGGLPFNCIVLFEGSEELGSPDLARWAAENVLELSKASALLNLDAPTWEADVPAIWRSVKGTLAAIITLTGAEEVHSGLTSGFSVDPARDLGELVASLKATTGEILIPGVNERARLPAPAVMGELEKLPFDWGRFLAQEVRAPALVQLPGRTPLEQFFLPSLTVNLLNSGGLPGQEVQMVVRRDAVAHVSIRLVDGQDPAKIEYLLRQHCLQVVRRMHEDREATAGHELPQLLRFSMQITVSVPAVIMDHTNPFTQAVADAMTTVFQTPPVYPGLSAGIPVLSTFQKLFPHMALILTGFSSLGSGYHTPREWIKRELVHRGLEALVHAFYNLGQLPPMAGS